MKHAIVALSAILLVSTSAVADIPQMVGYQGLVTDNSGQPVGDGTYTMRFRMYSGGGSLLWNSGDLSVQLVNGIFSVNLGESPQPSLNLSFDQDYLLLVTFDGEDQLPAKWLGSVGYAYMASGLVPGAEIAAPMTSQTVLTVKNTDTSGSGTGLAGWTYASSGGSGLYGYAYSTGSGENYGVYGVSRSSVGRGVYGSAWQTTGTNYGVYGKSLSTEGRGVYGEATSGFGYGVYGYGRYAGGYFADSDGSGYARLGHGDRGISAYGNERGGYFSALNYSGFAYVADYDVGIQAQGSGAGGEFFDTNSSGWAWVGTSSYKVFGNGSMDFVQNHPEDDGKVLVYAAPEGDEVATYTRGSARLVNGEARVALGETFKWVTNPDIGLTAHLTPRDECNGLRVVELMTSQMVVRELAGGASDARFDYIVYGLRIGFEETSVVQEKVQEARIPSMSDHRERYARYPDLRHFNALERFKAMRAAVGDREPLDLSASQALHDAIEEFDPAIHETEGPDEDPQKTGAAAARTHRMSNAERPTPNSEVPAAPQPRQ